jgi:hypothetical protein
MAMFSVVHTPTWNLYCDQETWWNETERGDYEIKT